MFSVFEIKLVNVDILKSMETKQSPVFIPVTVQLFQYVRSYRASPL
jgi:formylmethanofuran dehydrogenase subunit B